MCQRSHQLSLLNYLYNPPTSEGHIFWLKNSFDHFSQNYSCGAWKYCELLNFTTLQARKYHWIWSFINILNIRVLQHSRCTACQQAHRQNAVLWKFPMPLKSSSRRCIDHAPYRPERPQQDLHHLTLEQLMQYFICWRASKPTNFTIVEWVAHNYSRQMWSVKDRYKLLCWLLSSMLDDLALLGRWKYTQWSQRQRVSV